MTNTAQKEIIAVADVADMARPGNSVFKSMKKANAKNVILVGESHCMMTNTPIEYCVIMSHTMTEQHAKDILTSRWKESTHQGMRVYVWFPMNDMKESVFMNLEKQTHMRCAALLAMMKATGGDKVLQNQADITDVKQAFNLA